MLSYDEMVIRYGNEYGKEARVREAMRPSSPPPISLKHCRRNVTNKIIHEASVSS